jgi:asparagine synthase (glutamine-hydrolysing)
MQYSPSRFIVRIENAEGTRSDSDLAEQFKRKCGLAPNLVVRTRNVDVVIAHSSAVQVATDPSRNVTVFLHGDIYGDGGMRLEGARDLLDRYLNEGPMVLAKSLSGSHVILVVDGIHGFIAITDRVGSRRIYAGGDSGGMWLTSEILLYPEGVVDPAAVASYLVNRYIYNGRTIYRGVQSLERACVHRVDAHGIGSEAYWRFTYAPREDSDSVATDRMMLELGELIRKAVRRRIPANGKVCISMSGGVDSRGVLGALLEESKSRGFELKAMSYGLESDTDVVAARSICAQFGINLHRVSFRGNLSSAIKLNADCSDAVVFFYPQGLDGLRDVISSLGSDSIMFVGDECFGLNMEGMTRSDFSFATFDDLLGFIGIRAPAKVPSYYSYGDTPAVEIEEMLQSDNDALRRRCPGPPYSLDAFGFMYLDQRLPHLLLSWRENHLARFVRVANPLIDNDILEFLETVPPALRFDKRLYRATVAKTFPQVMGTPIVHDQGCSNEFLDGLFVSQQFQIAEMLSCDSSLDAVLPRPVIEEGLSDLVGSLRIASYHLPRGVQSLMERLRRRAVRQRVMRGASRGAGPQWHGQMALAPIQMASLLTLRWFLRTDRPRPTLL